MPTKNAARNERDDLRPEYDISKLTGAVRGKYLARATAGMVLVLLEPDVAEVFPDARTVNEALRALANVARAHARANHAAGKGPGKQRESSTRVRRQPGRKRGTRASRG
jgi:hypothetical protein